MMSYESYLTDFGQYSDEKELGSGRFGKIILVKKEGEYYAKRIFYENRQLEPLILREAETLISIRSHPSICKFNGFNISPFGMIFEYLPNDSLQKIFDQLRIGTPVPQWNGTMKSKTIFGIACAMLQLHNHGITHRYLTPKCILFDQNNEPCLTDFIYSRRLENSLEFTIINDDKNPYYQAPEIHTAAYDHKVDLFSFGMILYHIVSENSTFFCQKNNYLIIHNIVNGKRPDIPICNQRLARLMTDLWKNSPDDRPSFIDIVKALYFYDEKLFEDTNMDEYKRYRERILQSTYLTKDDKIFLNAPVFTRHDIDNFYKTMSLAEGGDVEYMVNLARMYELGIGTEISIRDAIRWYEEAANRNHPEALYKIAYFYIIENDVYELNEEEYLKNLKKSSELNFYPAIVDYAFAISNTGIDSNIQKAIEMLKIVADPPIKYKEAQYRLANLYESCGNINEAINYLKLSMNQGFLEASNDYALILLDGKDGTEPNIEKGITLLKQAASRGLPMSNNILGEIYDKGKYGQKRNGQEALKYYQLALSKGSTRAMVNLGKALHRGKVGDIEIEKNPIRAARLFEEAASKDEPEGIYSWAIFKLRGFGGTPINEPEALELLDCSARLGYIPAMMKLYDIYGNDKFAKNMEKALEYAHMAADLGYQSAKDIISKYS